MVWLVYPKGCSFQWREKLFHVLQLKRYASIEADLIYASENLAALPLTKGRATKGAALALLGKYLYQDNLRRQLL
jgi:hypothetical protein